MEVSGFTSVLGGSTGFGWLADSYLVRHSSLSASRALRLAISSAIRPSAVRSRLGFSLVVEPPAVSVLSGVLAVSTAFAASSDSPGFAVRNATCSS